MTTGAKAALCVVSMGYSVIAYASDSSLTTVQDQCTSAAMQEYAEETTKIYEKARQKSVFPTIDEVIDRQRSQESFCLKFSACLIPSVVSNTGAAVEGAMVFIKCVNDEEDEDVVGRLRDGDAKERDDAISRLRGD